MSLNKFNDLIDPRLFPWLPHKIPIRDQKAIVSLKLTFKGDDVNTTTDLKPLLHKVANRISSMEQYFSKAASSKLKF